MSTGTMARDGARRVDTTLVRVLAVVLIANSHLESLWPRPWMAGDGLLGNSLFYAMSGFGLAASAEARGLPAFAPWYARRLLRIYPALWIFLGVTLILALPSTNHALLLGRISRAAFIWPTAFGFIGMIVPIYAVIYVVLRIDRAWALHAAMALAAAAYAGLYAWQRGAWAGMTRLQLGNLPASLYWALAVFLVAFGAWMARHLNRVGPGRPRHLALAAALFVIYVLSKLAMVRGHGAAAFPVLHWCMPLVVYAFVRGLSDPALVARLRARARLWRALATGAEITLEVYIIHFSVAEHPWMARLRFPLNLAVFWAVVLPLAWALARVAAAVSRPLGAWLARPRQWDPTTQDRRG
jgi:peptidoglycan/LPS O-acetylase OafA/YrhL